MGCDAKDSLKRCIVCDLGPFCYRHSWHGQHDPGSRFFYMNSGIMGKKRKNYQ